MPNTNSYDIELSSLKKRIQERKNSAFETLLLFARGDLSHVICGYSSLEEAFKKTIIKAHTANEIEIKAFERRYPD